MNMPYRQWASHGEDILIHPPSPLPLEKEGGIFTNEILLIGDFFKQERRNQDYKVLYDHLLIPPNGDKGE